MKKFLKSIFNYKTILSSYIGAIGYGIGYNLPLKYDLHPIICIICCLVLGSLFDWLGNVILSKENLKTRKNKIILAFVIYGTYLLAWVIADYLFDYDLDIDFLMSIYIIIFFQIISIIINKAKDYYKRKNNEKNN